MNLNEKIFEALEINNNKDNFLSLCKKPFILDSTIMNVFKSYSLKCEFEDSLHPKVYIPISFGLYEKRGEKIEYFIKIYFSKILKVYYIEYCAEINNNDPDSIDSSFWMEEFTPMTKRQYEFNESLEKVLSNLNYERLNYNQLYYVILNIDASLTFFGNQPTVQMLMFNDLFDLLPD